MDQDEINIARAKLAEKYRQDWCFFIMHALGHYTWSKQREIIRSVQDNKYTLVHACHGASKTFSAAEIAVTAYNLYDDAKGYSTATTFPQVRNLLWAEIRKIYGNSRIELEGECLMVNIKDRRPGKGNHLFFGISPGDQTTAEGVHSPHTIFIFDEAKGVRQFMWTAITGSMSGKNSRFLAISTTDEARPGQMFYDIIKRNDPLYNIIHIDYIDLPTITGEKFIGIEWKDEFGFDFEYVEKTVDQLGIQLSDQQWFDDLCAECGGPDSPLALSKGRGLLADTLDDTLIPVSSVMKMFENYREGNIDRVGPRQIGVDVGRTRDASVICVRQGYHVEKLIRWTPDQVPPKYKEIPLMFCVEQIKLAANGDKKVPIYIDDTGVGAGVSETLIKDGFNVIKMIYQQTAADENKYPSVIDEAYFHFSEICHLCSIKYEGKLSDKMVKDLVNRKAINNDKRGRRQIESKQAYTSRMAKERSKIAGERGTGNISMSPDIADAIVSAFAPQRQAKRYRVGWI